jgi:hypothetical protein
MNKPFEIVVDRGGALDPVSGTTDCPLPSFAGMQIWVEKTGYGTYDYNKWQELSGGGFRLLGAGNLFSPGERFFVHFTGLTYGTEQSSYTNGFNFARVMNALYGRVGWRQPTITDSPVLTSINTLTKGGRVYQDFHSLVVLSSIQSVMEEVAATDVAFNAYLEAIQRGVILQAVNSVFKGPKAVEYLSQKVLFDRNWSANDQPVENKGNFVYGMFRLPAKPDLGVQVDSVALYFDSDVTFNLYVYHDAIKAPLAVMEVSAVADTQTVVTLSDVVLNYIGANNLGGTFYIGYYQDDIGTAKAYYESYCDRARDVYYWSFGEADKIPGEYNFVRRSPRLNNVNYGLNFHVSTFRDHTAQIVKKAILFDELIGLQMAAQMIEKIIYSTRSNGTERILKEAAEQVNAQLDLNGVAAISESPRTTGLRQRIAKEQTTLYNSFFPPSKPSIINYADY